jgi:recombination protein RecT
MSTKAIQPIDALRTNLDRMGGEFKKVLPAHISSDKFARVIMTTIQGNPELLAADRNSLFSACLKAATDGVLLDNREAALVVFKGKAGPTVQYMIMIGGLLKKLRNSGELSFITSDVVHANDGFKKFTDDSGEHLIHTPDHFGDRGEIIGAFAMAITKDGSRYIEVMSLEQILKRKAVSKVQYGPWATWFDRMACKTVTRLLCKRLPSSTDLDALIANDDESNDLTQAEQPKTLASPTSSRLSQIISPEEKAAFTEPDWDDEVKND